MIVSLLYVLAFAVSGVYIAEALFSAHKPQRRIWLGLVIGLFLWTWLPSLFAFVIGFTLTAQLLALGVALLAGVVCGLKAKGRIHGLAGCIKQLWPMLALCGIFVLGCCLFSTHILRTDEQGYWVGQVTYGDLAMHLGFITSIAEQGTFPPEYSIFVGHTVNYPFLCETSASTLLLLGSSLRQAYLISALYAYALVILGVYFFFEQWLKRQGRAVVATLLFFFGSGFGFAYFFDLADGSSTALQSLLGSSSIGNNLQNLLDGFYLTPTNLPTIGLRWVNPIVDMLIPQRATLFGWAFLFPCLYLLTGWAFRGEKRNLIPLIVLAGGLPLIHTHSFLALGVISAVYLVMELIRKFNWKRLLGWAVFGCGTLLLALPQLVLFTFAQASESGMVQLHFNWANELDSYLWFYLKNLGWLFVLAVPAFLCLSKRDRRIAAGPLMLWIIAELVVFQPNTYDNNKLIFVSFAFLCGLVARFAASAYHRIDHAIKKRTLPNDSCRSYAQGSALLSCAVFAYLFVKLLRVASGAAVDLRFGSCCTLLVLLFALLWLLVRGGYEQLRMNKRTQAVLCGVSVLMALAVNAILLKLLFEQYQSSFLGISQGLTRLMALLIAACSILQLAVVFRCDPCAPRSWRLARVALSLGCCVLALTTFLSSTMTIVREARSNYMVFSSKEIEAAEFIKEDTASDALFLTDANWHLNTVSTLTGRSIVCGANTFLYFHGIDTSKRRSDVTSMLEHPAESGELFESYGVDYVYLGSCEYSNYAVDTAYFRENCQEVFQNGSVTIYRVTP